MNDLKFAFRQLLKNPGFTAVPPQYRRPDRVRFPWCGSRKPGHSWLFCYGGRAVAVFVAVFGESFLSAAPLRFAGQYCELVVSEVSDRTVRLELFELDENGKALPPPPSTVLVPFTSAEKFRARELTGQKEVRAGGFSVLVKAQPLTVSLRRADGRVVQEATFDDATSTNAGVAFHTEATVLGLGEGAQQFDRRGAFYPMEPSWGGWNRAVLGSVVPSPFIIGTEGWALFAHRPEGQFDLRDGKCRFIPRRDARGRASLDLFVVDVREPADALVEYTRLTGKPVMPPKWALGYFQSHRTLASPDEPLQIARAFREKKLPCDALIYLGTGYCTNGWNTGHGSLAFNTNAFVPENIKALHDLNFKVVLHVNRAPRDLFGTSVASRSLTRHADPLSPSEGERAGAKASVIATAPTRACFGFASAGTTPHALSPWTLMRERRDGPVASAPSSSKSLATTRSRSASHSKASGWR
jgi:hypothetical protein